MPADPGIVIIAASLAGAKAAQTLRLDHGLDTLITLVGDEPHLPYQRPALSKGYLPGTTDVGDLDARRVRIADGTHDGIEVGAEETFIEERTRGKGCRPYDLVAMPQHAGNAGFR
jgi:3-phenylpropionate/trans-cinnamate dioxygenase ferredoxin reductase component